MEDSEKELLELLKNFDTKTLITKETYADIQAHEQLFSAYIFDQKSKDVFDVYISKSDDNKIVQINMMNFFCENDYGEEQKMRLRPLNRDLLEEDPEQLNYYINERLKLFNIKINLKNPKKPKKNNDNTPPLQNNFFTDKNAKSIDVTGYKVHQFFCGFIQDCLSVVSCELDNGCLDNPHKNLFTNVLDIIIYMGNMVKSNLKKYKNAYYNRKLLIVSPLHAILVGFDTLITNIITKYRLNFESFPSVSSRLTQIVNLVYDIIASSKGNSYIPFPCLIIFLKFIVFREARPRINSFDKNHIYAILKEHLKNLNENELKFFKKNSDVKDSLEYLVNNIYDSNMGTLVNETYYSYLLSCLRCKNLEKKMNALNDLSEIINDFPPKDKIDENFQKFIEKNKILNIFFEDSIHDEIIKRSINLFKYFAKYDSLNDNIIEKIIEKQSSNEPMKKLFVEVLSELPKQKKDSLFKRLVEGIKLNNLNNIEFILKLTESCFNKSLTNNKNFKDKNYYGLNIIFDYIIDLDDNNRYDENMVDTAIDSFESTIFKILRNNGFDINDVLFFIEQLFENIKNNPQHNSIVQSIKLIIKLLNIIRNKKDSNNKLILNLKKLDEQYDIINLFINDLIRYIQLLPSDYTNEKYKDKIYEGIYPHNINMEQRLKIIFYFFKKSLNNYGLDVKGQRHIEKVYQILFKPKNFKDERKKFYEIFTNNINEIEDTILFDFFKNILMNKNEFNLKEINDNESINFIIHIFNKVNENKKTLFNDGRNIRIEDGEQIEGFDMLFDLLTKNSDKNVQNKISQLLCDICLSFKDYNNPKIPDYWKIYFKKVNYYLDSVNKSHDKVAFNGIIKLLNKIYSSSCNCYGKIPEKDDYKPTQEPSKIYHFILVSSNKDYRIKVGVKDRIIDMRWKLGYYYDIPVNNVTFIDLAKKTYSLNNDFENFMKIFSHEKYQLDKGYAYIKVEEVPFQLLQMKDNPKDLIEKNENIYSILIDNLKIDLKNNDEKDIENENKEKIWNIISKLPKNYYFENKLKKYGNKESSKEKDLQEKFNINQIYLLTYSLQCFHHFLFNTNNEADKNVNQILPNKKEYLNNFIEIFHGDKLIFEKLLCINIDKDNFKPIQIQCLTYIIDVLNEIEKYKENEKETKFENIFENKDLYNNTLKKLIDIISNLLGLNYTKYKNYINQINDDSNEKNKQNNKEKEKINENIANLIEHIFNFMEEITTDKVSHMQYLFNNKELFIKVFVYDYIKSETDESRKKIDEFLIKNYIKNNDYFKKYFEIILTVNTFNYLLKNDKAGKYFHVISSIMKKYYDDNNSSNNSEKPNKDSIIESNYIKQSREIIDIILEYIQRECDKKEDKNEILEEKEARTLIKNSENCKEGILLFLRNMINLNPKEFTKYILNKVDIYDLFLNKCCLRKCVENPLETKEPFCRTNQSQNALYSLLILILKNIQNNELYLKIIENLSKYHQTGLWKTYNYKNWDLESKEMIKGGKYVGLKNMNSTCYLNSIIQQLYMIPMFRETILKIGNPSKNNVLFELQILFAALKIYEFSYYDPRSFVVINKLNFYEQMDADEFYGTLIDKIENDIKNIYLKTPTPTPGVKTGPKDNIKNETYKYKEIFNYFFGIKVLDELKFVDCGHKRYNEFFYNSIQLEIKGFNNIYESLKNYFKTEIMDGDNKINCEQCKIKRICHKHLIFKSLPNILVIALKRFEFDYNTMLKYKLNKYFEFPYKLDMKDYLIEDHKETNTEYELTGITIHFGVADFGHYYDLIKGPDNKWYKFNDISVSEFKEEDIPREAFGEKEIGDEDFSKEKESGKNNAYILIYTKKNFRNEIIDKKAKTDLALPPYSNYSNISEEIKKEINLRLFDNWTRKTVVSPVYRNFIFHLLALDLARNMNTNTEKGHYKFIKLIKNEGFKIESNKNSNMNTNNTIFEFCLIYYFNVILRVSRRDKSVNPNYFDIFKEIINIYMENDPNKAKYILEEFSNDEAIKEYLVLCPNPESVTDCQQIIMNSFVVAYNNSNSTDTFSYEFMDSLIIFIDKNIRQINLESVNAILINMINAVGQKFLSYLNRKSFGKWLHSFYGNGQPSKEYMKNIINENLYPPLHSNHSILINSIYKKKKQLNEESDMYDQQFYQRLNNLEANIKLLRYFEQFFE